MTIDISKHYFNYYANTGETNNLTGFSVGEIVIDWYGEIGCILQIFKSGEVRTDSNGMGDIAKLKKTRNRKRLEEYLKDLHNSDMKHLLWTHDAELKSLNLPSQSTQTAKTIKTTAQTRKCRQRANKWLLVVPCE